MGGDWRPGRLADFAEIVMGTSPPGDTCNDNGEGTPLLNGPTEFTAHSPVPVQFTTQPVKLCEPGDVLFCVRGSTTGRMNWADYEYAIGRGLAAIRHRQGKRFQAYVRGVIDFSLPGLLAVSTGSTFPSVSRSDIENVAINVPPLIEQHAISYILGTLDDKIESNYRINRTLEAMARAIFKSWFVDFEPVKAKAAGQHPPGLTPNVTNLFPCSFEDSELGEIPEGWRICRWGEIATLEYGKSLRAYSNSNGPFRVFGTNGPIGWHSEPLCNVPGIVIGRKGAYRGVHYSPEPFFVIDTAFYLRPIANIDLKWAYYELLQFDINGMDSGSAIPSTSRDDFYAIPVCLPSPEILRAYGAILQPLDDRKDANQRQNATLGALRNTLLPKLISGELRVPDAEGIVGRAV